jgi:uncharacterized glyoxalase superfamily protein PhnB
MEQCRDDRERQRRHLATHNIPPAVAFYRMLGFEIVHGGDDATFTSFRAGTSFLNLVAQPAERKWSWCGRVIFYHSDVDALYARVIAAGYRPGPAPRGAEWDERFLHLTDPDGHELSFAWPLRQGRVSEHNRTCRGREENDANGRTSNAATACS